MTANEKVFAMAGYSLNVQPVQMPIKKFVEDNICSLIINVKPELKLSKELLLIALPLNPDVANTMFFFANVIPNDCHFSFSVHGFNIVYGFWDIFIRIDLFYVNFNFTVLNQRC